MTVVTLWIYIVFLLIGGAMGFVKGKSKVSLIMAAVFAVLLAICNFAALPLLVAEILLGLLLVVFGMRLAKTKKFMPSGLMLLVTTAALVLLATSK